METINKVLDRKMAETQPNKASCNALVLSQSVSDKVAYCRKQHGTTLQMVKIYTETLAPYLDSTNRRDLIGRNAPSVTILSIAYGRNNVSTILEGYLIGFADAMGAMYDTNTVAIVANDIINGWGHLPLSEVALALRMAREGRFRTKDGRNLATQYGTLNSAAVSDCLFAYCKEERTPAIEKREKEAAEIARQQSIKNAVTYEEYLKLKANGRI